MAEALDALSLPLQGSRLIEASAGTGKTWTIAALYLRFVLGHGCRPRNPGEILVLTFTKAATRELSDRIRRRLVQAADCFRGEAAAPDDFLAGLQAAFPAGTERQQAAWRLSIAADAMDEAAVQTIDAWCQRMLREHAFDSACPFDEELLAQEAAMRAEAVRDYWRQQVYPLAGEALDAVLARWSDVAALDSDVQALIDKPLPADAGRGTLAQALARAAGQRAERLAVLKTGWAERADAMRDWLQAIWNDKKHPARPAVPAQGHAGRWIDALQAWALDPALEQPDVKTGRQRLAASDLGERLAACGARTALPECFTAFEDLMAELDDLPAIGPALRLHAAAGVLERVQRSKQRSGAFGFADMLERLDAALDDSGNDEIGENGAMRAMHANSARARRLRQRIVLQYPVALIDEFQDTSPIQLRIVDRLYRIADDEPARALLLIGDPKQAIYGFRGADIYSYLGARRATAGRHHVLGINHRSTQALVSAVNALFQAAESRPGEGAFRFRQAGSASPLPFVEVGARGRAERLVGTAGAVAALTMVSDLPLRSKDDSRRLFAALCAERIVTLLNDAQAGFVEDGKPLRRLQPADIAVLVRTGREAEAVRHEMRRRGLASVYLSDKDTVFQTPEAADLLRLLQAVAAPRDVRRVRAALATRLLSFTLPELVALACDDARFDRQCERLQQLNQVWAGQGVLAMLRQALHAFGLPARWLAPQDPAAQGERRLTNVLQLAELLQAASAQADGEQALIHWLQQQLADGEQGPGAGDERVLRLESDADLVQVVTVHKSKGLEYPLVFLPFASHFREVLGPGEREDDAVLLLPATDAAGATRRLVLSPSKAEIEQAEKERQREDLRLLYVALTRAQHALWVSLSGLRGGRGRTELWQRSAIGYLLSGDTQPPPEQRAQDLQALARDRPEFVVQTLPDTDDLPLPACTSLQRRDEPPALAEPVPYRAVFDRHWSISSYSALVRDAAWAPGASGAVPTQVLRDDEPDEAGRETPAARPIGQPWHRFPRGALAGNFLHDQLEWLAGERFALDTSVELQQRLVRRCERQGWGHRAEDVLAWLRLVCSTPLPVPGVALSDLSTLAPELEFWIPSDGLQARRLDELCRQHLQPGRPRPQLPERALQGLLMGFADLVFEQGGRYWVLDYKSNTLGPRDGDYTAPAMEAAMLVHRYDVQATLYLLALHRLLKSRLGAAYAPARHLGGAVYLFLRGIRSATNGCCAVAAPLALIEAVDAMLPGSAGAP